MVATHERYRIAKCLDCKHPFRQLFWQNRRVCDHCMVVRSTWTKLRRIKSGSTR